MESFLKRTASASFVPRLLSIGPSMSHSVYLYSHAPRVAPSVLRATRPLTGPSSFYGQGGPWRMARKELGKATRRGAAPRLRSVRLRSAQPRPGRRHTTRQGSQEDRGSPWELADSGTVPTALEYT